VHVQKAMLIIGIIYLLVIVWGSNFLYCQPSASTETGQSAIMRLGSDFSLTIGLDVWPNQWVKTIPNRLITQPLLSSVNQRLPLNPATFSLRSAEQASSFGVGFIPTVTLTYKKKFFLSSIYMATPDYDFGSITPTVVVGTGGTDTVGALQSSLTASRREVDLTMGYFPLHWLGVAIGYKGMFQDFEFKNSFTFLVPSNLQGQSSSLPVTSIVAHYNGPIAGVLASVPIDQRFTLVGNVFGGYLFSDCHPSCAQGDSPYTSGKLVLRYAPTSKFFVTLGYRVQVVNDRIDVTHHNGTPSTQTETFIDLTHGPVFGVNYRF
jgi:hypothetical protein